VNRTSTATEAVLWSSYPSWRQFSWLYLISALVAWRALLFRRFDLPGWEAWLVGALALLIFAALLRRWARYEMTPTRLIVRNGFTGREIVQCPLSRIERVELRQGPVANLLGIGTLVIRSGGEPAIRFRGLRDPEAVKQRIIAKAMATGGVDDAMASGF
jgi:membrane protein YdbS with pleckstrin-like domain